MSDRFNWHERRPLETIRRRLAELRRRLDEPSYVGPFWQYTLAEESALRWMLRVVNSSPAKTLGEILEYERKMEREERDVRQARVGAK